MMGLGNPLILVCTSGWGGVDMAGCLGVTQMCLD